MNNGNSKFKWFSFILLSVIVVAVSSTSLGRFSLTTLRITTPTYNPTYASKTPTSTSTSTGTSTFTETSTATSTATATSTPPPPQTFKATVMQPSHCYNGPDETYLGAIIVPAETKVDILGMNSDSKDWFMIDGETIDACWIQSDFLNYNADPKKILILTTAFTTENCPCRTFPQEGRTIQAYIPRDWRIVINAKIVPKEDWVLVTPHDSTDQCWVAIKHLTSFSGISLPPVLSSEALVVTKVPVPTSTRRGNNGGNDDPAPVQPTSVPPTAGPGTPVPPTSIPPTPVPPTSIPPTDPPQPTATLCWPPGKCK